MALAFPTALRALIDHVAACAPSGAFLASLIAQFRQCSVAGSRAANPIAPLSVALWLGLAASVLFNALLCCNRYAKSGKGTFEQAVWITCR